MQQGYWGKAAYSPQALDAMFIKLRINTYKRQILNQALRNDEPVKGVTMMKWESLNQPQMRQGDGKQINIILLKLAWHQSIKGQLQYNLAQACLDCDLP